jgi:hypothetical protein
MRLRCWNYLGRSVDEVLVGDSPQRPLSEATVTERSDPTIVIIFLLTVQLVTLFLIGASFYLSTVQAREAAKDARKGVACLIEQMSEHRFATQASHDAAAAAGGYEVHVKNRAPTAEEIEDTRRRLIVNCDDFLR